MIFQKSMVNIKGPTKFLSTKDFNAINETFSMWYYGVKLLERTFDFNLLYSQTPLNKNFHIVKPSAVDFRHLQNGRVFFLLAFQAFSTYIEIHIVDSSAWIKKYLLYHVQIFAYPSVKCKNMTCLNDLLVLHVDRNFRAANPKYWAHSYVHWKFNNTYDLNSFLLFNGVFYI